MDFQLLSLYLRQNGNIFIHLLHIRVVIYNPKSQLLLIKIIITYSFLYTNFKFSSFCLKKTDIYHIYIKIFNYDHSI